MGGRKTVWISYLRRFENESKNIFYGFDIGMSTYFRASIRMSFLLKIVSVEKKGKVTLSRFRFKLWSKKLIRIGVKSKLNSN